MPLCGCRGGRHPGQQQILTHSGTQQEPPDRAKQHRQDDDEPQKHSHEFLACRSRYAIVTHVYRRRESFLLSKSYSDLTYRTTWLVICAYGRGDNAGVFRIASFTRVRQFREPAWQKFDKRETEKLSAALTSLTNGFKANQLARELLKSKSESLLCDKLSDRLNALEDEPDIRVVREWENGKREGNRQRIDLAWLRGDRPVALIEAKVAKSFDLAVASDRCYPSKELRKDMDKLRSIGCGSSPYLLLFIVHNHGVPKSPQGCNIPYMKRDAKTRGHPAEHDSGWLRAHSSKAG